MTLKQQTLLKLWLEETVKANKPKLAMDFLLTCKITPSSNNNNIHIHWEFADFRFDLWPSTDKMWITDTMNKEKYTYLRMKDIQGILTVQFSDML